MSNDIILALAIGIGLGFIFFIVDIYNEKKTKEVNTSLIAGVTVTYFFIILLPEIEVGLSNASLGTYKFIGILLGFSMIHLTEKFILIRVEKKSQIRLKQICDEELELREKGKKIGKSLAKKLGKKDIDNLTLMNLIERLSALLEIRKIQDIWIEEERHLKKKMLEAEFNKYSYLVLLSAVKVITKIQRLCLKEEKKLEYSIKNEMLEIYEDNPTIKKISEKLHRMNKIRQRELHNLEKKKELTDLLITSLMADKRDKM